MAAMLMLECVEECPERKKWGENAQRLKKTKKQTNKQNPIIINVDWYNIKNIPADISTC